MFSCQKRHCFYIVCKLRLLYSLYLVNKDIRESYCCLCNWFSTTIHHHSKCRMNHEKVGVRRTEHGLGDSEGMTPKDVCYITMLSEETVNSLRRWPATEQPWATPISWMMSSLSSGNTRDKRFLTSSGYNSRKGSKNVKALLNSIDFELSFHTNIHQ